MNKLVFCLGVVVSLCGTSASVLMASKGTHPVLPPRYNLGSDIGKKMGDGFSKGFERGFEDGVRRNEAEANNAAIRRETEANNALLAELLQGYTPARHSEYVLRIMQSNLPSEVKQQTIQQLESLVRHAG